MGPCNMAPGTSESCRHPSSLHTFEFTPVQHPSSAFPQLKLSEVTLAFLSPHPH